MADAEQPLPDRDVVTRLVAGDQGALRTLYDRYFAELWRFAAGILKGHDAADDVVQDAFIAVWNRRDALDPAQNIRAYLYRAVRNGALMVLRAERTMTRAEELLAGDPSMVMGDDVTPTLALEGSELHDAIVQTLAALTERQRTAAILRWLRQMSYDEVATSMGISRQAVYMLLQRTHAVLGEALAPFRSE